VVFFVLSFWLLVFYFMLLMLWFDSVVWEKKMTIPIPYTSSEYEYTAASASTPLDCTAAEDVCWPQQTVICWPTLINEWKINKFPLAKQLYASCGRLIRRNLETVKTDDKWIALKRYLAIRHSWRLRWGMHEKG
jgi:hypothetical protein